MRSEQWCWTFYGFQTQVGNKPVRDWINGLPHDAIDGSGLFCKTAHYPIDELLDVLAYMQVRPNVEWHSPQNFKPLEAGLSEIRFSTEDHWYRIYGIFWPIGRAKYTFLHGTDKKVKNDKDGKKLANDRRDQLRRRQASIHEFSF